VITVRRTITITAVVDIHVDDGHTQQLQEAGAKVMVENWLDDNFDHMSDFYCGFTEA
jgi:hypothetical protein